MEESSKADKILEQVYENLDPESFRFQVLTTARKFKANWVELGEKLTQVATEKFFEEWGYKSFEEYCRVEIKIKKSTAMKLTNAWFFLKDEAPEVLEEPPTAEIPDLDAVSILQKARTNDGWTQEMYDQLRESALEKKQTGATLAKKYKEINRAVNGPEENEDIKSTLAMAKRLNKKLSTIEGVPEKYQESLTELENHLATILAESVTSS